MNASATHRSQGLSSIRRTAPRRLGALLLACALAPTACHRRDPGGARELAVAAGERGMYPAEPSAPPPSPESASTERYRDYGQNPWVNTAEDRLSTFAADVDTASYTIARRKLSEGVLPPPASVRIEEFVNYFRYELPAPSDGPFAVTADAAPSPFADGRHVLRVAVASKVKSITERRPMNLVFLVDTSGSMNQPDKLGLAQRALHILVDSLKDGDTVALTTYAGSSRVVLPSTSVEHREQILAAIDDLGARGGTAMGAGVELAYREAAKHVAPGVSSRVIVLSDGDANIGPSGHDELLALIAEHAHRGIALSTIGFGMGNYKDELMEQLADRGDGNNFYIDSIAQARRVFQEQLGSTLEVVARDVKLQVEFDPSLVARYRLLGYENRDVADHEFRNDQVDAGELGAGHQVTALYEVELTARGAKERAPWVAIHARFKGPGEDGMSAAATERTYAMDAAALAPSLSSASPDLRFAVAVAAFAELLRQGEGARTLSFAKVRELAASATGSSADREELVGLIDRAAALSRDAEG